jgi:methyl-accepting chemotaxis protein
MPDNREISNHTRIVEEIAFRASILALHAAIAMDSEGESGLECALVADEVRGLARRGAQSAQGYLHVEQEQTL